MLLPEGEKPACVEVEAGRITAILAWDAPGPVSHECGERVLLPGVVDTHVHCNEPGRTEWEGFRTATRAAAAGGVTTIVDMPLNSIPATTTADAVRAKVAALSGQVHVDVGLWGGVVPGNAGDIRALAAAGVLGFKCFLSPSGVDEFENASQADVRAVSSTLAALRLPLLVHAEDPARLRPMPTSTRRHSDWLASRPAEAEASAIRMLGRVCIESGLYVHIVHVASGAALDAIAQARADGARMTAETCPHYLTFACEEIGDGATEYKCAPPIRSAREREALRDAVVHTRLDLVASDHSPAPPELKETRSGDFASAWGGIASLELALPATWTALASHGITLTRLSQCLSAAPARLAGLERSKGSITVGHDADLVVFDPDASFVVDPARLYQRHPLTPYAGRTLRGVVHGTWLRGRCVHDGATVVADPAGRWLQGEGGVLSAPGE